MLSQRVQEYVAEHRGMGFKYRVQNNLLLRYAEFAIDQGDLLIKTTTVIKWCEQAPSPQQKRNRLLTLRRFAIWLRAENSQHQVPSAEIFGRSVRVRRTPYIYSNTDIDVLLSAASESTPKGTIRPLTFRTLIGLLLVSGLRISEALALDIGDIGSDGLIVRATKFNKSRLVPIHDSTRQALAHYIQSPLRPQVKTDAVFVSILGTRLAYSTAISGFLTLLRSTGLREAPGRSGPCLHDLRHTFAVRSLEECPANAKAIARHVIYLSTYLGHTHMADTYWYLEATPRLAQQIANDSEALYNGDSS